MELLYDLDAPPLALASQINIKRAYTIHHLSIKQWIKEIQFVFELPSPQGDPR